MATCCHTRTGSGCTACPTARPAAHLHPSHRALAPLYRIRAARSAAEARAASPSRRPETPTLVVECAALDWRGADADIALDRASRAEHAGQTGYESEQNSLDGYAAKLGSHTSPLCRCSIGVEVGTEVRDVRSRVPPPRGNLRRTPMPFLTCLCGLCESKKWARRVGLHPLAAIRALAYTKGQDGCAGCTYNTQQAAKMLSASRWQCISQH